MSKPVDWEGVEPFGIDKGELEGLSPQECFVLGVEYQMVIEYAISTTAYADLVDVPVV